MDIDEDMNELERLFWSVIKPYDTGIVPPGTVSMGVPSALTRALAILVHRQGAEVRAALRRVEDALPNVQEHPGGQVSVSECNLRITSVIRAERARLDRLEAEVDQVVREIR
jgi:NAD(P)-dependent dehydrogenase (short-subunit alcohol dehydrogenase family)